MEHLTDKQFWEKYWKSKNNLYQPISRKYIFSDIFEKIIKQKQPKTAIEIGGFPGFHSVFLYKYFNVLPSLLDLVIIPSIVQKVCEINNVSVDNITYYENDFFSFTPPVKYDLVFSNGFIEHFSDTELIIKKHLQYLEKGGTLLITLPNFKSLNGLFQKIFDRDNYNKHNIACMDINFLRTICESLQLKDIKVFYYGYFSIWLEEKARKNWLAQACRAFLFYPLKIFFSLTKWNTRYFSPYIVIEANL